MLAGIAVPYLPPDLDIEERDGDEHDGFDKAGRNIAFDEQFFAEAGARQKKPVHGEMNHGHDEQPYREKVGDIDAVLSPAGTDGC